MKKTRTKVLLFLFVLILVLGAFVGIYYAKSKSGKNPENTNNQTNQKVEEPKAKKYETPESEKKELKAKFDQLLGVNKETIGYIYIPGTQLDEPILQTKDNSTYLVKTFEGQEVPFLGAVFMDYENNKDFSDPLTWLFGHARGSKVDDHRMFNDVNFFESQEYMDAHPYVVIETPTRKHYYVVEFLVKVPEDTDLYRLKFNDVKEFDDQIKKASSQATVVAKGAKLAGTSNYIVLSTCREDNVEVRTNLYCREVSDYELNDFLEKNGSKLKYVKTR